MEKAASLFKIRGTLQHYSWGGATYIAQLLGLEARQGEPNAEYWMGAHRNHPSLVSTEEGEIPLDRFIEEDPALVLGQGIAQRFGSLPYLFKVLDVKDMLSIQVHPDKASAVRSFAEENRKGIPINAPHRNYKDENHKPELMYALSEFWLLHGFKSTALLEAILSQTPELQFLLSYWREGSYEAVYRCVMEMPQQEVDRRLGPLVDRILPLYQNGQLPKSSENFWAARAVQTFCPRGSIDRGLFSIYLFNIVQLQPGQAIFQDAGILHAYLEGQNLELMANSDNVLRGGLTPKHVDVPELMKYVRFQETLPQPLAGLPLEESGEWVFPTPVTDFEFRAIRLGKGEETRLNVHTCDVFLVVDGVVEATASGKTLSLHKGECFIATAGTRLYIRAVENLQVFRATAPYPQP